MKKTSIILLIASVAFACTSSNTEEVSGSIQKPNIDDQESDVDTDDLEYNLLFIGNSLTGANNLPNLVKSYAKTQGKDISVEMIAYGNYALVDHWQDGAIQSSIESKNFDFVIVQQGPSSQAYGRRLLIEYGGYISELCNNNDAKLAYYMVWPSLTNYYTFDGVINSYRMAANINNDILCPVGEVWKSHFDQTDNFSYYGSDGFHPSITGSRVAAQVIYESLFGN